MAGKYIMVSLDDERSKHLSEVLANETCKKILMFMSEISEVTETDISKSLNIPLNTVNYNMKKLLASHLVEEAEKILWSEKGRRIRIYRISNKSILITPRTKSRINKILTALITLASSAAIGLSIKFALRSELKPLEEDIYSTGEAAIATTQKFLAESSSQNISKLAELISSVPSWGWFLGGSLFALIIILILNWKRM
ncbi:winged helix-turn-helix transcriptional regulator [Candidatus Pacearchaeota archaeon]|nr:winged helix-turn-helix transcriptional regulator [Candidatus Pacearchaeota archaeon]